MTRSLECVKKFHFNGLLLSKVYIFELKEFRGVIFHDAEERWKLWRGTDLSFQNWHAEFENFWPIHSNVSRIFTLIGFFWTKYILFDLNKYRGDIFHDTQEWRKIWLGLTFQNWCKEFEKFLPEQLKVSNTFTLIASFWTKYTMSELKKLKIDAKFKGKLAWLSNTTWGIWQISPGWMKIALTF